MTLLINISGIIHLYENIYPTQIDYGIKRKQKLDEEKALPLDRNTPEDFEFGYMEPKRITPGHFTLRQALKFITDHQSEPEKWTAAKIAEEYKLKPELTGNTDQVVYHKPVFIVF